VQLQVDDLDRAVARGHPGRRLRARIRVAGVVVADGLGVGGRVVLLQLPPPGVLPVGVPVRTALAMLLAGLRRQEEHGAGRWGRCKQEPDSGAGVSAAGGRRPVGVAVAGFGWMGRVHTQASIAVASNAPFSEWARPSPTPAWPPPLLTG
jgi:hypothetical protein